MFYRLWFIAFFLFSSLLANASTDITTAKGTDQSVIVQLTPQPGSSVSIDTAIEAQFGIDLDPASVQTNNVKLRCLSCDNQGVIQGDASYVAGDRRVVFSHPESLEAGIYEVEYKSLKTTKANKDIKIGEIKYRFEVTAFIPDTTPPVITLNGTNPLQLFIGQPYEEKGATATDETDGNVSVEIDGTVDTSTAGSYTVTYSAADTSGNQSQSTRTVTVIAPQLLSLKLESSTTSLNMGEKTSLTLTGSYEDNSTNDITDQIEWIITPSGAVDINATSLTALKDTNVTIQAKIGTIVSNTVNLEIYWEVNGHRLPPEPDPAVNDSTLLGIDSNDNGVRDDVERYIYTRFMKEYEYPRIKTLIAMQYAKAYQFIMSNDPQNAFENKSYKQADYASDCKWYWFDEVTKKKFDLSSIEGNIKGTEFRQNNRIFDEKMESEIFNTKLRMEAYYYYNSSLSGQILSGGGGVLSSTKDKCDFDIDSLDEI